MPEAITNTSPLLYLYRIGEVNLLYELFDRVWTPNSVIDELRDGQNRGYDVPDPDNYSWIEVVDPRSVPSEWLTLDLGPGELSVLALALENPDMIVLLDDSLARRIAQAASLQVWGTLRVLVEAKGQGIIVSVKPLLDRLEGSGLWISDGIRQRILTLAGED